IRTALAQIVAEELDVPFERVHMVLGTTSAAPDQGATIASETIQITAVPLRQAAATARRYLLQQAAAQHGVPPESLSIEDGSIYPEPRANWSAPFGDLISGRHHRLTLDPVAPLKSSDSYKIVGKSQPRTDIAAKATGRWTYVHDVRVPGMLHG